MDIYTIHQNTTFSIDRDSVQSCKILFTPVISKNDDERYVGVQALTSKLISHGLIRGARLVIK